MVCAETSTAGARARPDMAPGMANVLGLQRLAGNAAVAHLLPKLPVQRTCECGGGGCSSCAEEQDAMGEKGVAAEDGGRIGEESGEESQPLPVSTTGGQRAELPGTARSCPTNVAIPASKGPVVRDASGTVGERFTMRAEWQSAPYRGESSYCAAECGEYHQFVRGHMLASSYPDGSNPNDVSPTMFGGQKLDPVQYKEDGRTGNPAARYGHRDEPTTMNEQYLPDRKTGPTYKGEDFPSVSTGTWADIDLDFLGKTVDTCAGTDTSTHQWRVAYQGLIRP